MISLPWRPAMPTKGWGATELPPILTSITERETTMLQKLARDVGVLEVGTAYGYSAVAMGYYARHVLSVDRHDAHQGSLEAVRSNLRAHGLERRVTLLLGDSLAVLPLLEAQFELIFLDGCHRFAGLWADLQQAQRLLAKGGQLAVHDYEETSCPEVQPAVDASGIAGKVWVDTLWVSEPRAE